MRPSFVLSNLLYAGAVCCLLSGSVFAQQRSLSIREAVSLTREQQPQLRAQQEQANAAAYSVGLAKNTLLPDLTASYQAGYATYNNITGMTYPGGFLPISGPPSAGNTYDAVPGSVLSALLKWTPLTFGQRQAAVEKAAAQYQVAASQYNDALFRQQYTVIATYLDAVYLRSLTASYEANIARTATGLNQALVLAKEGLRPGIDTAQFQSVLAQAEMDLLTLQRRYFEQLAELAKLTGLPAKPSELQLTDTAFLSNTPDAPAATGGTGGHPQLRLYESKKVLSEAALKEIQRGWRPRFDVWANAYARGSGVAADGSVDKTDGWSLSRKNYGLGVQLSFPILGFAQANLQKKQYRSLLRADEAQLQQVSLNLQKQQETAQFNYDQQLLITRQSTVQTRTARFAFDGLKLGYESGLIDYTRLMQGQYELLKAETAQAGAYLQTWRALLDIAVAGGNLQTFLDTLK
ncbi:TolC family protein [Chitinophaga lutea]|uniref:TolC family protein n=1 Tax=Chitinophaga lutea TaxID=2488634 RepID=A0A3N4PKM4_9BACT|nr:TolC family protein [Chitinophaga lutea]RPE08088.1 TolC family protein [Chitinophaga lutea]